MDPVSSGPPQKFLKDLRCNSAPGPEPIFHVGLDQSSIPSPESQQSVQNIFKPTVAPTIKPSTSTISTEPIVLQGRLKSTHQEDVAHVVLPVNSNVDTLAQLKKKPTLHLPATFSSSRTHFPNEDRTFEHFTQKSRLRAGNRNSNKINEPLHADGSKITDDSFSRPGAGTLTTLGRV